MKAFARLISLRIQRNDDQQEAKTKTSLSLSDPKLEATLKSKTPSVFSADGGCKAELVIKEITAGRG